MRGSFQRRNGALPLLLPTLLIMAVFTILPLIEGVRLSFTDASILNSGAKAIGLQNYRMVFLQAWTSYTTGYASSIGTVVTDFPLYFWNSLRIAMLVTLIAMVVSIVGAYGLSRYPLRGKSAYIMGVFGTQMFPVALLRCGCSRGTSTTCRGRSRTRHASTAAASSSCSPASSCRSPPRGSWWPPSTPSSFRGGTTRPSRSSRRARAPPPSPWRSSGWGVR